MIAASGKLVQLQRPGTNTTTSSSSSNSRSNPPPLTLASTHARCPSVDSPTMNGSGTGQPLMSPSQIHPLRHSFTFWFMHRAPGQKLTNYENSMRRIASFSSVEDFWAIYSHLMRPDGMPHISDIHLFRHGVRPVWEDELNMNGGKWIVRLRKGLASRYWEELVMAIVGDQFHDVGDELCGAVLSIRNQEDILSVWNKTANLGRANLRIRDAIKKVLNLPMETLMEYKSHTDAIKDNRSYGTSVPSTPAAV
ncbi:hypothetical protein G7K_3277-t1 [Saitoella complicata NRRL Y-17804]|uniref:Uncharacterized protein n=2 Tax=Saitoella complicata (strain BCRC 22490 / CBS 7301 / JCM 7358 / NBRC 10748 / NRRL Y-17804) TaxID=698492 RepID=A0A0E9NH00_SAICN|nr:hypothetical protein G7K_3277-t1 [Saitoella complicata NRRL Y-17804]